jgi:hypothetical protein
MTFRNTLTDLPYLDDDQELLFKWWGVVGHDFIDPVRDGTLVYTPVPCQHLVQHTPQIVN